MAYQKKNSLDALKDTVESLSVEVPKKIVYGRVVKCDAARIRDGANIYSKELTFAYRDERLEINLNKSTSTFYAVTLKREGKTDISGYTLKELIAIEV